MNRYTKFLLAVLLPTISLAMQQSQLKVTVLDSAAAASSGSRPQTPYPGPTPPNSPDGCPCCNILMPSLRQSSQLIQYTTQALITLNKESAADQKKVEKLKTKIPAEIVKEKSTN